MPDPTGGPSGDAPGLDDVFFLQRSFPGVSDLWTEAVDWAPTVFTAVAVLSLPYLLMRVMESNSPVITRLLWLLAHDRFLRGILGLGIAALVSLGLWQMGQLWIERRRRVVRLDLHEIECWPDRRLRYLLVRDVVGAQAGRTEQRSRWWVLRAPRHAIVLFVKRPGEDAIERVRFDWSRHQLLAASGATPWAGGPGDDRDGNHVAADVIALLRRRRMELGLPLEELPDTPIDHTAQSGVRLVGDRDQMELQLGEKTIVIPGWAVRSAAVLAAPKGSRSPLQLALDLDPRCGEFHLQVPLGKGAEDEKIVQWCQLMAARFDKLPAPGTER